jgi:methionyl-tRNA formyltransferase
MLAVRRVPITATTTAADLHDQLAVAGAECLQALLPDLAAGRVAAAPQPAEGATYARKLEKDEGVVDWRRPAAELDRQVRALAPWPGTRFRAQGEEVKLLAAVPADGSGDPGTVIAAPLVVACGEGALSLLRVQRPGRAPVDAQAYVNGARLAAGAQLPLE